MCYFTYRLKGERKKNNRNENEISTRGIGGNECGVGKRLGFSQKEEDCNLEVGKIETEIVFLLSSLLPAPALSNSQ